MNKLISGFFSLATLMLLPLFTASASAAETVVFSDDFNTGSADGWTPVSGQWSVVDGQYVGTGPDCGLIDPRCTSFIRGLQLADVEVEFDVLTVRGYDRILLLRQSTSGSTGIGLNFRAPFFNDVAVGYSIDGVESCCQFYQNVSEDPSSNSLHVRVRVVGDRLTIWVNKNPLPFVDTDGVFPASLVAAGGIGLSVFPDAEQRFDNVVVREIPPPDPNADTDADNVRDADDNCTLLPNPSQCDSDGDGYGNRCDGDLTQNGVTNAQDAVVIRNILGAGTPAPIYNIGDLNCNGVVNAQDTVLFRQLLGSPPGPSGLVP